MANSPPLPATVGKGLLTEHHKVKNGTTVFQHTYTYDLAGNRETKEHEEGATDPVLSSTYDAYGLNELTNWAGTTGHKTNVTGTVSDDNLASVTVWNRTADPDRSAPAQVRDGFYIGRGLMLDAGDNDIEAVAADKAGNETTAPPSGTHTITLDDTPDLDYHYDDAGCLEYVNDGTGAGTDELLKYVYDDEHRLVEVIDDPDGDNDKIVEFVYDALGRRVEKIVYADENTVDTKTRYIYAGQNVIEEYVDDSGWVLEAEYVHGNTSCCLDEGSAFVGAARFLGPPASDNVLTIERGFGGTVERWYYLHDGLGSVTEITDSNGDLVQAYEYDAWGNPTIYNPDDITILSPYMYTGRRWDSEINLYYYRARYYDPQHGRFIRPDPLSIRGGLNLYEYGRGRPTCFCDAMGMSATPQVSAFISVGTAALVFPQDAAHTTSHPVPYEIRMMMFEMSQKDPGRRGDAGFPGRTTLYVKLWTSALVRASDGKTPYRKFAPGTFDWVLEPIDKDPSLLDKSHTTLPYVKQYGTLAIPSNLDDPPNTIEYCVSCLYTTAKFTVEEIKPGPGPSPWGLVATGADLLIDLIPVVGNINKGVGLTIATALGKQGVAGLVSLLSQRKGEEAIRYNIVLQTIVCADGKAMAAAFNIPRVPGSNWPAVNSYPYTSPYSDYDLYKGTTFYRACMGVN